MRVTETKIVPVAWEPETQEEHIKYWWGVMLAMAALGDAGCLGMMRVTATLLGEFDAIERAATPSKGATARSADTQSVPSPDLLP